MLPHFGGVGGRGNLDMGCRTFCGFSELFKFSKLAKALAPFTALNGHSASAWIMFRLVFDSGDAFIRTL